MQFCRNAKGRRIGVPVENVVFRACVMRDVTSGRSRYGLLLRDYCKHTRVNGTLKNERISR